MIEFFEHTWFAWWLFAIVLILRWFHVMHLSETTVQELDQAEVEKSSAVAA